MGKDEAVVKLTGGEHCGAYLAVWFSSNPAMTEGCDACIGYTLYDEDYSEIDGGEMDYNSDATPYGDITDALQDVVMFVTDGNEALYEMTDMAPEDLEEKGKEF